MENNRLLGLKKDCPDLRLSVEPAVLVSHGVDSTQFRRPAPCAVSFPDSPEQVRALVRSAETHGIALVPSGGRTGLSGGAVATNGEMVVSFDRMRKILEFDAVDRTLRVEAGVVTAAVQAYASENDLFYPVSFAAEGSSQIGGNVATNAGGIRVLRHGLTRDQVVGMKVVSGKGELLGLDNMEALMNVFASLRRQLQLSAFEFLTDKALHHVRRANDLPAPLDTPCGLYVVTEFDCPGDAELDKAMSCFDYCVEQAWVLDGVISQNSRQNMELWRYREGISESISPFTPYRNDLSVRVSTVPEFLRQMDLLLAELCPDLEVIWYGHIGDGNLHLNILKPEDLGLEEFEQRAHEISERTYSLTQAIGGSISAEHGIGILKSPWLSRVRSEDEIRVMRGIKQVFDPAGIFNPGKLFP